MIFVLGSVLVFGGEASVLYRTLAAALFLRAR
jgi:hypothetical protein